MNGQIIVKRYFDPVDILEAKASPFCFAVAGPIIFKNREEAIEKFQAIL